MLTVIKDCSEALLNSYRSITQIVSSIITYKILKLLSDVFRVGRYCLINKASDIFLFTILLLKPCPSVLSSFNYIYVSTCVTSYPHQHFLIYFY